MEEKKRSIGGIWKRTTKKGDLLLSMRVELDGKKYELVGFKNGFKTEDKHPDFSIFLSEPYTPQQTTQPSATKQAETIQEDDDLPF